jgi:hypothetical protein
MALGLLAGLVAGCGAALVVDRRSGRVFSQEELQQLLPGPLLAHLNPANATALEGQLTLLARGPLAGSQRVGLIPVGLPSQGPQLQRLLSACSAPCASACPEPNSTAIRPGGSCQLQPPTADHQPRGPHPQPTGQPEPAAAAAGPPDHRLAAAGRHRCGLTTAAPYSEPLHHCSPSAFPPSPSRPSGSRCQRPGLGHLSGARRRRAP